MISKQYFEETFSIDTARALQEWANNNLIVQGVGDYGMKIAHGGSITMFAETEVTGFTIGNEYILSTESIEVISNVYRTKMNALPNDNASTVAEMGYGLGKQSLTFTATAETMYIAIGDENGAPGTYMIVDNITLKIDGVEAVSNGTFEAGNTTGWYAQGGTATITPYDYVVEPLPTDNPYLENISLPVYNVSDTTHCLIGTDGDWNETTLNSAQWQHYFVPAGTYTGRPTVTRSGTDSARITVSPYNQELHPASLAEGLHSRISLDFNGASYWTISKMCGNEENFDGWLNGGNFRFVNGSTYNILDQLFFGDQTWYPVSIQTYCHNNTVQKCHMDGINDVQRTLDGSIIQLEGGDGTENSLLPIWNTKVIANDFKNCNVIRLQARSNIPRAKDYSGTIVDSNNNWYDGTTRCDEDGTPNVNGDFAIFEQDFSGIKSGSVDENNPVIYSNNTITSTRQSYPVASDLSAPAPGLSVVYYYCKYIHQRGNVLFDCPSGTAFTWNIEPNDPVDTSIVEHNVFDQCGFNNYSGTSHDERTVPLRMQNTDNCTFQHNFIRDPLLAWATVTNGNVNPFVGNNTIVNKALDANVEGTVPGLSPTDTNTYLDLAGGNVAKPYDYTITYGRYTTAPTTRVLENVIDQTQEEFIQSIWAMS